MIVGNSIEQAATKEQANIVSMLAREIWNEHFVDIIGQDQVDYMLGKFQNPEVIQSQITSGYEYYLAFTRGKPMGYLCLIPHEPIGKMMVSKIYVKNKTRGAGLGSELLEFAKQRSIELSLGAVWLTVNRGNHQAIEWYKKKGFTITGQVKTDIGNGFYMDDYVMEYGLG